MISSIFTTAVPIPPRMEAEFRFLRALAVDGGVALRALVAVAEPVRLAALKQQVLVPRHHQYLSQSLLLSTTKSILYCKK